MWIKLPNGSIRQVFNHDYGINKNAVTHRVFDDKIITGKILEQNSISTPQSFLYIKENTRYADHTNNIAHALRFCRMIWFPIILKPLDGSQWRWVKKIENSDDLQIELDKVNLWEIRWVNFVLQQYNAGKDIRVIYLDGKIELAYMRIPATIVGDGIHDIQTIIYQKYKDTKIEINIESISYYLRNQWLMLSDVPHEWRIIQFVPTANVSTWWDVAPFDFDHEDELFVSKIATLFGARYFGLDILTHTKISQGSVLEINKMPGTTWPDIIQPNFGKKLWAKIRQIIKKDEWII